MFINERIIKMKVKISKLMREILADSKSSKQLKEALSKKESIIEHQGRKIKVKLGL